MARLGPGALVWAAFDGPQVPGELLDGIRDGRIGGLVLFSIRGNVGSKEQVRSMLVEAQGAAVRGGVPPIPISVDQEGGGVVRIAHHAIFPSAMAIAATDEPGYAERAGRAVAEGLRADGITVNLAPVCDVNVEAKNPVIGARAFGDDPQRVAAFASAWVRGSESGHVASCAKHFPGHGGTAHDSHVTTQDVNDTESEVRERDLPPFRAAIAAGVSMVMSAHVRYPALDAEEIATFSHRIQVDLLRGKLGFAGLTITDATDMSGVTLVEVPARIAARAVTAGSDAVMITRDLALQLDASEEIALGVTPARIKEAIGRAAAFRERFGGPAPSDIDDRSARELAAEIARRSVTQVGPPLPGLGGRIRVTVMPARYRSLAENVPLPPDGLEAALRARFGERLAFERDGREPAGDGTLMVCTSSAWHDAEQAGRARELLSRGGILCALRSPYDAALVPTVPSLLTYGDVPASLDALAAVLAGELTPRGKLPVRLPAT